MISNFPTEPRETNLRAVLFGTPPLKLYTTMGGMPQTALSCARRFPLSGLNLQGVLLVPAVYKHEQIYRSHLLMSWEWGSAHVLGMGALWNRTFLFFGAPLGRHLNRVCCLNIIMGSVESDIFFFGAQWAAQTVCVLSPYHFWSSLGRAFGLISPPQCAN